MNTGTNTTISVVRAWIFFTASRSVYTLAEHTERGNPRGYTVLAGYQPHTGRCTLVEHLDRHLGSCDKLPTVGERFEFQYVPYRAGVSTSPVTGVWVTTSWVIDRLDDAIAELPDTPIHAAVGLLREDSRSVRTA